MELMAQWWRICLPMQETWGFNPWVRKILWSRKWESIPVSLPEKVHGERSLAESSPWGCKRVRYDLATKQQQLEQQTVNQIINQNKCKHTHKHKKLNFWKNFKTWTVACEAPLSMGFSRQEYWSGLLYSPPEDLPNPGIKVASLTPPALAGGFFTTSTTWEAPPNSVKT